MTRTTGQEATPTSSRHGRRAVALACGLVLALVPAHAAQARLGDLDPSFGGDGIATPDVGATGATGARFEALTTRGDGRPVAAGWARNPQGLDEAVVVQLTGSGELDPAWGTSPGLTRIPSGGFFTHLRAVAIDDTGRVLAAGDRRASTLPEPGAPYALRLTPGGASDPTFTSALGVQPGEAHAVIPLPGGGLLVGGWRRLGTVPTRDVFFVARLTSTGALDDTFGLRGTAQADFGANARAEAMAVGPDGRIVLAGWVEAPVAGAHAPALASFDSAGAPDSSFDFDADGDGRLTLAVADPLAELHAVQVDGLGRITAAGFSGSRALVVRRQPGGAPDAGFGAGGATYGAVQDLATLDALAFDGARALVAGMAAPAGDAQQLLLGAIDAAGTPEAGLGGAPPGWRSFPSPIGGDARALGAAPGPGGTVYTAGPLGAPPQPYVSRHAPNAAPVAALTGPAQVLAGAPAAFDAAGSSDPEGEQLSYAFDLDGNGSYEFDGGTNPLALRSFPDAGGHSVGVRVTDPRGASATATRGITVVPAPVPPPQPVLGKQGVASPLRGIVRFRLPGTKGFVRMLELTAIPNGTEIDVRKGRLLITVLHDASGQLDGARFYGGRFSFRQGGGATPITTLKLSGGSFKNCTIGAKGSVLAVASSVTDGTGTRSSRRVRSLWGSGRGRFRTRGRYGAATVRGTKWLTIDRCDGTKVRVVRGKVAVQDLVHPNRRPELVKAGRKTFVPYKRGG